MTISKAKIAQLKQISEAGCIVKPADVLDLIEYSESLRLDAERYRHARDKMGYVGLEALHHMGSAKLDAHIDANRSPENP